MIYKKFIIIFLLILSIFSVFNFSSVHAENINVTSSSTERMKFDIDYLKQVLKNNNINNMNDLKSYLGINLSSLIEYIFIEGAGHKNVDWQNAYFYRDINKITVGDNDYSYYGISQNSFTLRYTYYFSWRTSGDYDISHHYGNPSNKTFTAPSCWFLIRTDDLFTKDSSEIVVNAVGNVEKAVGNVENAVANVDNSINNLNNEIIEDNSSQDDINLGTHNDEMNNASDTIKNSNLYSKFNNVINEMNEAFTYNDDEVSTIPFTFYGKSFVLRSDEISSFFKNNNLAFVVTLWQSILWFSLLYTMFLFIRKLYKSFTGGNPVDEVSSTLSSEDNKIVGGF